MRRVTMLLVVAAVLLGAVPAMAAGQSDLAELRKGTAKFHKVSHAEAAGYASTLDGLGCFENPGVGGMGLHYLNESLLLDGGALDASKPEALVYEMRADGRLKLVGVEYIVLRDDSEVAPQLFGRSFHAHPVLPLWVLHAWVWKPNPLGMFEDWNPRVALCPEGVPVFGA